ncbi:glycoside hydrolase family 88/105 protein [Nibricoccus aquaticus]|nr:glycoside hydrolase family 88 protein [Nibricoccus aquaticus]
MIITPRLLHGSSLCLGLGLLAAMPLGAQTTDYTKRINGDSAVAVYPVPYTVPKREEIKAVLDRIKGYTVETTTLKVFDNKTGQEIAAPDMANLNPNAVVDRRYGNLNFWDYTNGVVMSGFSMVAEETGDQSYFDYNVRFYDFTFTWMPYFRALEEKTKKRNDYSRMIQMSALDHCGSITAALIRTQMKHPDPRYRAWIDNVADFISNKQFRFEDGSLARERPQPRSVWTDDFYMGVSFLAQMGKLTGDTQYWDDGVKQITQLSKHLFISEKGLYDHGWSENTAGYDPRFYWGRANGWATMAMCELLSVLPKDFKGRDEVLHLYRQHMRSLIELQDGTGLWHNMLDKSETYLETSASAMFVYGLAKGVNEGWLSPAFGPAAITGWNGVVTRVLPDGRVDGICEGTTYANDNSYYFFRGASANTNFFGSVIYAGAEMMKLVKNPEIQIVPARPDAVNSAIHFRWTKDAATPMR